MGAIDTRTEAERASLEALLRQGPGWTVQGGEVYSGSETGPFSVGRGSIRTRIWPWL